MSSDQILAGRYRLIERLHLGEQHETLLVAAEEHAEQVFVLKRLLDSAQEKQEGEGAVSEAYAAAFIEAARLNARFDHRAICPVHDVGSEGGAHYFVRDYVAGKDLRDLKRRHVLQRRQVPEAVALYLAGEICAALDYALHLEEAPGSGRWTTHGGLRPRDVLLGYQGQVKLINFSSSHWTVLAPSRDESASRPGYCAPEQLAGEPADASSDVFSVGVILYELLTGAHPYAAGTDKPAPPPSAVRASLAEALDAVLLKAVNPQPDRRHATAEELAGSLRELSESGAVTMGSADDLTALMRQIFPRAQQLDEQRVKRATSALSAQYPAVPTAASPGASADHSAPVSSASRSARSTSQLELETLSAAPLKRSSSARPTGRGLALALFVVAALLGGVAVYLLAQRKDTREAAWDRAVTASASHPASVGSGTLHLAAEEPVDIFLDGGSTKLRAPLDKRVPAGEHSLDLVFPESGKRLSHQITIRPGQALRLRMVRGRIVED